MGASSFYNIAAEAKCHNSVSPYCLTIMNNLLYTNGIPPYGIPPYIHQASLRPDWLHWYRSRNTVNTALLEYRVTSSDDHACMLLKPS